MTSNARNIALQGARGRMGMRIAALASERADIGHVATLNRRGKIEDHDADFSRIDAVIDFSTPEGALAALQCAREHRCALLVGTTGLDQPTLDALEQHSHDQPVMIAPNTSLGVAVLKTLVQHAASLLDDAFDVDLVDVHHHHKKDAPSGTAKALAEAANAARPGALPPDRIHALRTGGVVGQHTIRFSSPWEEITLEHNALTRDVFAAGALRAALWLADQEPGLYSIESAWQRRDD